MSHLSDAAKGSSAQQQKVRTIFEGFLSAQKWIGQAECPPFDVLITDLAKALDPQTPDPLQAIKQAVEKYKRFNLPGYGADGQAFTVYLSLANRADQGLQRLRAVLDSPPAPNAFDAATAEALRLLRDVQRTATVAQFDNLTNRADRMATIVVNYRQQQGVLTDAIQRNFRKELLRAIENTKPFKRIADQVRQPLYSAIREKETPGAANLSQLIQQALPVLTDRLVVGDDRTSPLTLLVESLYVLLENTLKNAREGLNKLSDIEQATAIVKRIKDAWKAFLHSIQSFNAVVKTLSSGELSTLLNALNKPIGDEMVQVRVLRLYQVPHTLRLVMQQINGTAVLVAWRREEAFFDDGAFPRIKPWFDTLVAALQRFLETYPLSLGEAEVYANRVTQQLQPDRGSRLDGIVKALAGPTRNTADEFNTLLSTLVTPPPAQLVPEPTLKDLFLTKQGIQSGAAGQVFQALHPQVEGKIPSAVANATLSQPESLPNVEVLRASAAPFGSSAPPRTIVLGYGANQNPITITREWPLALTPFAIEAVNTSSTQPIVPQVSIGPPEDVITKKVNPSAPKPEQFPNGIEVTVTLDTPGLTVTFKSQDVTYSLRVIKDTMPGEQLTFAVDNTPAVPFNRPTRRTLELPMGRITLVRSPKEGPDVYLISGELEFPLLPERRRLLALDATYDKIAPGSHIAIQHAQPQPGMTAPDIYRVEAVDAVAEVGFGISAKVTRLLLDSPWLNPTDSSLAALRGTSVLVQGEPQELAEEPYDADVFGDLLQLDGLIDGLEAKRLLLIEGERTDLPGTRGVRDAELVAIASVEQSLDATSPSLDPTNPGPQGPTRTTARPHTIVHLQQKLQFAYRRDTVTVYGNVAHATHGESKREVMGNGDASKPRQRFALKQGPLTYLPAVRPSGAADTLEVRVNDVLWREVERLTGSGPDDRVYAVYTDEQGGATVQFGDGRQGARPATGVENIRAVYRAGLGQAGNVKAKQITQLGDRPPGVKDVVNPLPAAGGADREPLAQARRNTPTGLTALERLVSVADYEDFARAYAGIAKARAVRLAAAGAFRVHVTVAAQDDNQLPGSALFDNLLQSLHKFGDPELPVVLAPRRLLLIVLEVTLTIDSDYEWDKVRPAVQKSLLSLLGFDNRQPAQDVYASPILAAVQGVAGVRAAHLDLFGAIPERDENDNVLTPDQITEKIQGMAERRPAADDAKPPAAPPQPPAQEASKPVEVPATIPVKAARWDAANAKFVAAELAYLSAKVPATLVLRRRKP